MKNTQPKQLWNGAHLISKDTRPVRKPITSAPTAGAEYLKLLSYCCTCQATCPHSDPSRLVPSYTSCLPQQSSQHHPTNQQSCKDPKSPPHPPTLSPSTTRPVPLAEHLSVSASARTTPPTALHPTPSRVMIIRRGMHRGIIFFHRSRCRPTATKSVEFNKKRHH